MFDSANRTTEPEAAAFTRRRMLQVGGLAGVGAVALLTGATGCTDTSGVSDPNTSKVAAGDFQIPDNAALPKDPVSLRWTDSGDQKAAFLKPFFEAYRGKHANITVDYRGTNWPAIQQEITLGVRNGSAPDVFQLPGTITLAQAVKNKWVGPIDDIVPNWAEVKQRFPAGAFAAGITDFQNKTFGLPVTSTPVSTLLLYNKSITDDLEVDLTKPLSWDEYRALNKAITKKGDGKYYGLIMALAQANGLQAPIDAMCWHSGVPGGASGTNWKTGDFNFTNPLVADAIDLFLAMKADGSIFPGSTSLIAATARGRFPQGVAGTILQGPWNIAPWTQEDPNFKLGLNLAPVADVNDISPIGYRPGGGNAYVYSSKTSQADVVGDLFGYLASEAGQVQWANLDGAGDPAILPGANTRATLDPLSAQAVEINQSYLRLMPEPGVRNPDVELVYQAQKAIQPTFADVCVGLFTGQITGVKKAMQGLQDRSNKALDDAIKTARGRGAEVSRNDWVFADWDPKVSYDKLYQK